jgi:hypothetical protein
MAANLIILLLATLLRLTYFTYSVEFDWFAEDEFSAADGKIIRYKGILLAILAVGQ